MLIEDLKRFVELIVLLVLQVFLFNHIHIMGYATPLVGVTLLLYVPANNNRITTLIWAFVLGLLVDMFSNTPGISAASLTLAAMIQPGLLKALMPKDALEDMTPSYKTMGTGNHIRYFTLLLLVHHVAYFLLQSFSFFNMRDLGISMLGSFALSWLFIAAMETLRRNDR